MLQATVERVQTRRTRGCKSETLVRGVLDEVAAEDPWTIDALVVESSNRARKGARHFTPPTLQLCNPPPPSTPPYDVGAPGGLATLGSTMLTALKCIRKYG